jgi:ABC-2 type transport system ATP-binding protein
MRSELAAAFLHTPKIAFLDEPSVGLDILVREKLFQFLGEQNRKLGITYFLTSHDLEDIEMACDRVILIDSGQLIFDGSIPDLKDLYLDFREIKVVNPGTQVDYPSLVQCMERSKKEIRFRYDPSKYSSRDVFLILSEYFPVENIFLLQPTLRDVVKAIMNRRC